MYQVNELLRQEISRILLTELNDTRFERVTVTSVNTSADLHYARVFVQFHGDAAERDNALEAWSTPKGNPPYSGKEVRIMYNPSLEFTYDDRLITPSHLRDLAESKRRMLRQEPEGSMLKTGY
jgi:ribosome-binding factor A